MEIRRSKNSNALIYLINLLIFCNLFIGWGFQNFTIFGIPVNEIAMIIILIIINIFFIIKHLNFVVNILPFIFWLLYGVFFIFSGYIQYGIWALRDGSHVIDSLFLIIGFFLVSSEKNYNFFFNNIKYLIYVGLIYVILLPFKNNIQSFIPNVAGAAGYNVTLSLFNYTSITTTWVWLAFYSLINYNRIKGNLLLGKIIPFLFIFTSIVFFQQRMIYLSIVFILIFLLIFNNQKSYQKFLSYIIFFFILSTLISFFNIPILGRIQNFSSLFLFEHVMSTFGYVSEKTLATSGTVDQRLLWLMEVMNNSFSSTARFIFGNGFGTPLIEFSIYNDVIVREPHNTYLSIYGKMGLAGFFIWIWTHICFFNTWRKFYRYAVLNNKTQEKNRLLGLIIYIIIILVCGITTSIFESTWIASMYYIIWGIIFRICYNIYINSLEKKLIVN